MKFRRVLSSRLVRVLAVATVIALAGPTPSAGAATPPAGLTMVVHASNPLAPTVTLTNHGTAACQVATTSYGTVGVTSVIQGGHQVTPTPVDPGLPDGTDIYLASRLTPLAPGASVTFPLRVIPFGPTGHAIEAATYSVAGSLGALYPVKAGTELRVQATYAIPAHATAGATPCPPAATAVSVAAGAGRSPLLIVIVVAVTLIVLAAILLVLLFARRHRRAATTAAGALLVLAAALAVPARPAYATVSVDPSLSSAYAPCAQIFGMPGGDPGGILPKLNDPGSNVVIMPANGDQTHEIKIGNQIIIFWDPNDHHPYAGGGGNADPCTSLYHEMYHGNEDLDGGQDHSPCVTAAGDSGLPVNEVNATRVQNQLRAKLGLPQRTHYGEIPLPSGPCLPKDQQPKPKPPCSGRGCGNTNGDPHLTTFDGLRYDFQGAGEFIATRDTGFEVQVRQQPAAGTAILAVTTAVAAGVAGDTVEVDLTATGVALVVDHRAVPLDGGALPHGGTVAVDLTAVPPLVTVAWPDGSHAYVSAIGPWGLHVLARPADARAGKLVGLFGNFNGDQSDDLRTSGGRALGAPPAFGDEYPSYADSWRITAATSLFTYPAGASTATYTDRSFPAAPLGPLPGTAAAAALCARLGVTDARTLADCTVDVAATGQADFALADRATQDVVAGSGSPGGGPSGGPLSPPPTPGPTTSATLGGTTTEATMHVVTPNGTDKLAFPATAGQRLYVDYTTALPSQCGIIYLEGPTGASLDGGCVSGGHGDFGGDLLTASGTYTLLFQPRDGQTGDMHVRLTFSTDRTGTLPLDGSPVGVTIDTPGQVATYTFAGTAGDRVLVQATDSTLPNACGIPDLHGPGNSPLAGGCLGQGHGIVDGTLLSSTGQYSVIIDPADAGLGTVTLRLIISHDQTGTLIVGGAPVTAYIQIPGQLALFTFTGSKDQKLTLAVTASSLVGLCGVPNVLLPGRAPFQAGCIDFHGVGILPLTLPEGGTYTVVIDLPDLMTGTVTLRLTA